jgi:RNA polymerase sigma-70 factor (ECF subfamily)
MLEKTARRGRWLRVLRQLYPVAMADDAPSSEWSHEQVRAWLLYHARLLLDDRLRGKVDPSDVVQKTLLKALEHQMQLRGQSEAKRRAGLRTILANTSADLVRRYLQGRKRNVGREQSLEDRCGHGFSWP